MRVAVVVPTLNAEQTITGCLSSLLEQTRLADEIFVVDGGSADSTQERVDVFPSATLISDPGYDTPGAARNAGAQKATGDIVVFTDSDCVADARLLEHHVRPYLRVEDLDGVRGHVRSASEGPVAEMIQRQFVSQEWVDNLNPDGTIRFRSTGLENLSVRREVILRVPFREDMESCEDTDLYLRMRKANLRVLYEPRAVVSHRHPSTLPELFRNLRWYGEGFHKLATLWSEEAFRKYSIFRTSFRFLHWPLEDLRNAVTADHSLICRGCPYGVCAIWCSQIDAGEEFNQELFRQISCLGFAAGILRKRTGYTHNWPVGPESKSQD